MTLNRPSFELAITAIMLCIYQEKQPNKKVINSGSSSLLQRLIYELFSSKIILPSRVDHLFPTITLTMQHNCKHLVAKCEVYNLIQKNRTNHTRSNNHAIKPLTSLSSTGTYSEEETTVAGADDESTPWAAESTHQSRRQMVVESEERSGGS